MAKVITKEIKMGKKMNKHGYYTSSFSYDDEVLEVITFLKKKSINVSQIVRQAIIKKGKELGHKKDE